MLQNNMRVSRSFSLALDAWRAARRPEPRDFRATMGFGRGKAFRPARKRAVRETAKCYSGSATLAGKTK
jgi:hypothetical protein